VLVCECCRGDKEQEYECTQCCYNSVAAQYTTLEPGEQLTELADEPSRTKRADSAHTGVVCQLDSSGKAALYKADETLVVDVIDVETFAQCREVTDYYLNGRGAFLRLGQLLLRLAAPLM
jgi:hypothetical protein